MACNNCNECNPCSPTPCVQETCSCPVFITSDCVEQIKEDMPYTGITSGKTFNAWILALDEYLQDKFTSIENFFKLKNVGAGAKIYKGISILGEKEIRSLTSVDSSVTITENMESIDLSAINTSPFKGIGFDNASIVVTDRDEDNYGEPGFRCIDFSKSDSPSNQYGAKASYSCILNGEDQEVGVNAEGSIIGGGYRNAIYNGEQSGVFTGSGNSINGIGGGDCYFIGSGFGNSINDDSFVGVSSILNGNSNILNTYYSTILGGNQNEILTDSFYSSIIGGDRNEISNNYSFIGGGIQNKASGQLSTVINGGQSEAKGNASIVLNGTNVSDSHCEVVGGNWGTTYNPVSRTSFNIADRIFNIGVGTDDLNRKDGISLFKNGVATLPTVTNALIAAASGKAVVTKEYLASMPAITYSAGTGLSLVGTTFSNTAPDQTVALTQGGATIITGTYPNFTISSTDTNTTYTAGSGLVLTGTVFSAENLQKVITYPADFTGTNYTLTNSDNNYEIIIANGATNVTITVPSGLTSKIGVGFTQKGIGDVTYIASGTTINNPTGLKIKGQYYQTYISQELATNNYFLGGSTRI